MLGIKKLFSSPYDAQGNGAMKIYIIFLRYVIKNIALLN